MKKQLRPTLETYSRSEDSEDALRCGDLAFGVNDTYVKILLRASPSPAKSILICRNELRIRARAWQAFVLSCGAEESRYNFNESHMRFK